MSAYQLDPFYGIGAVSLHANTPRVIVNMQPSVFLKLAHRMDPTSESAARTIAWVRARLSKGIGYPVLHVAPPLEWRQGDFRTQAKVIESDGRHRVNAIYSVQGDLPVPVVLVPWQDVLQSELNTWLPRMNKNMINQDGETCTGNFWTVPNES